MNTLVDRPLPFSDTEVERIRAEFPILRERVGDKPLVYLDNAASAQMPKPVLDRLVHYQLHEHANIHRAVHHLSELATTAYEGAREQLRRFINAKESRQIVYTRGTTDAINLVMHGYGRKFIQPGDEVLVSELEHHSNIVPWQMLCEERQAQLKVIPIDDRGELRLDEFERLLGARTKLVAVAHVSNALGTVNPIETIIAAAHARGVPVLIDGAQAAPHLQVDVTALDCDFYAFSGHKMCGPTGIGVLYAKSEWLEKMQPYQGGGDMILSVSFKGTTYNVPPHKFEAGTPPIAAAIGLGAAADYLRGLGLGRIAAHEASLLDYATERVGAIPKLRIIGTAPHKAAVLSFVVQGIHPHDLGTLLNEDGVAVRTGHHCAQPVMQHYGVAATARASFAFYNTHTEVDALAAAIRRAQEVFG
jgi:cysteine desulfurase/selenocysteine lyase